MKNEHNQENQDPTNGKDAFHGAPEIQYARGGTRPYHPTRKGDHSSALVSFAITLKSSSVVVSPFTSPPAAICLSKRRMILPERVFGRASAKRMSSGLATGPISLPTC